MKKNIDLLTIKKNIINLQKKINKLLILFLKFYPDRIRQDTPVRRVTGYPVQDETGFFSPVYTIYFYQRWTGALAPGNSLFLLLRIQVLNN